MRLPSFFLFGLLILISSCEKETPTPVPPKNESTANINFTFRFDDTQERLNNIGLPTQMPSNHAGQSPKFNEISAHYFELAPSPFTQLGEGQVLYTAPEVTTGGSSAIDFSESIKKGENELYLSVPISQIEVGDYEYLRVSLAYQNYDVDFLFNGIESTGILASFIGFNTYIENYNLGGQSIEVNENKLQGYWGATAFGQVFQGDAAATTVPNPISSTSPIPAGSCVVTGPFEGSALQITGTETEDINVTISLSTQDSFEWVDKNADGKWEPAAGENVVDMGIRGMIPRVE